MEGTIEQLANGADKTLKKHRGNLKPLHGFFVAGLSDQTHFNLVPYNVLDENLGLGLKTHDLRPGWTPTMGRGIHLRCRRDPPWLGTLKVIFSWLVFGRHRWSPYPHSSPPPWSRVRSYLYMKYIPIWSVIHKRYWMEHPCPLPLADFLFWAGYPPLLCRGSTWNGGHL